MTAIDKIVETALGEVGYLEKATAECLDDKTANAGYNNFTKYGKWFGWDGVYWCAMFVSWLFYAIDEPDIAPKSASCYLAMSWYRKNAEFHTKSGYIPQAGDQIFFSSPSFPAGGAHTGIVIWCDGERVYTVEGNTASGTSIISNGGQVAAKDYRLDLERIYGYGTPNWYLAKHQDSATDADNADNEGDDYMTKAEILKELGDEWIETYEQLPEWAKPDMREILDAQYVNGGTDYAIDPDDINMFLSDVKSLIVTKRMIAGGK